jgi:23S rRNA (cytidine1920-2'-O)/16S rRNA (cytidine1409-2'-O)-methyltransferase
LAAESGTPDAAVRERLDQALVQRGLVKSRSQAQALIRAGLVRVDGEPASRADQRVGGTSELVLAGRATYASRGGEKLAGVLPQFGVDPRGRTCLDAGASTGGFTDVLLQRGASRVYAVDVGYGQLDWRLRQDPRVVVMERVNIRNLRELPGEPPDLLVGDLSFISLRQVVPALTRLAATRADLVLLVKPQFEVGRGAVGKGGVVRREEDRRAAVDEFAGWARSQGLTVSGMADSPIRGARGNQETFVHLRWVAG